VPDTDTGGTTVTFRNSPISPASGDPIVGRIAFWTDDETGKININTASEGAYNNSSTYATSFSDTPRVCTPYDLNLEKSPACQNEFQRLTRAIPRPSRSARCSQSDHGPELSGEYLLAGQQHEHRAAGDGRRIDGGDGPLLDERRSGAGPCSATASLHAGRNPAQAGPQRHLHPD
ncbi:MAG: hypothetical protein WDO13_14955, partial [Verrucomicrobiota bacterium]